MKRAFWAAGGVAVISFLGSILILSLCFSSNVLAAADDWASQNGGTTGGEGGPTVTVTDEPNFIKYATSVTPGPYIVQVSGTIILPPKENDAGALEISANKTIRGIGEHPTLVGNVGFKNRDHNIIIERLNITNPLKGSSYDGISVKTDINNVFITKCTFYDCGDGQLDISGRSSYVTVSWCKFYYTPSAPDPGHTFSSLVGSSDNQPEDRGKLKVTYHHNWWTTGCKERMPRVRFGRVHVYNNYYSDLVAGGYCIGVGVESNIRVENNYFNSVPNPWADYYTGNGADGSIGWNTGNIFYNCARPTWATNNYDTNDANTTFTPPYSYTLDNAQDIPAVVQNGAGADGNDTLPPHWAFTYYGDFDRSGIVDMNDLPWFVDYWLDTTGIANADYYADGIVNFREFALLASNWRYIAPDTTPPAVPKGLWALGSNGTVPLDWADNNEPDFAGYNIYRSATSGSGYSKLNTTLLNNSNYTDNDVINGTMYYYVVTAADTLLNESGQSVEACAVPDISTNIILQENATGFCSVDGPVESEWAGFTGAGYANTDNALGNGVNWKINVPSDGNYTFVWRYALVTGDRTGKLIVNGATLVPSISFPASGATTTYIETAPIDVALTAGINDLRLEATTVDGLGNIDNLKITGIGPQAAGCQ